MSLKQTIEQADTPSGRIFALGVQGLILVSLVCFSIETLPALSESARRWLYAIEVATVAAFTVEYILRLLVSDSPLRFALSFYGLVDLVAILPFYLFVGIDLRSVRVLRLFRLIRIFKLARYNQAALRFRAAFIEVREELTLYLIATALTIYLASVGVYHFESEAQPAQFGSVFHCLWWSIVTLTTVGYGDAYPITVGGRIFTGLILFLGLGIVAVPTGLLASALTRTRRDN